MLDIKKSCLVIIDVQGKLAQLVCEKQTVFRNITVLIQTAKTLDIPIIHCQQNPRALGPTIPELAQLLIEDEPVDKFSFSCCRDEKFIRKLDGLNRKQIILCGIETHVCVYQTAADLLQSDYEVHIISDAVSSRCSENKKVGLDRAGTEGAVISSTEMMMFELLKTAKHEKFKELAKLIK